MANIIDVKNKELLMSFSFLNNVVYANDNNYKLDQLISSLNIDGVDTIDNFISFLNGSYVKNGFITIVSDKMREIKGKINVVDAIIRIELDKINQIRIKGKNYLGFSIEIDSDDLVFTIKNIFTTKMESKPVDFESHFIECPINVTKNISNVWKENSILKNIITSKNFDSISKMNVKFSESILNLNKYLNFWEDKISYEKNFALPYLHNKIIRVFKIDNKFYIDELNEHVYKKISNRKILYLSDNSSKILLNKKIPFDEIFITELYLLINQNDLLFKIQKSQNLNLVPLITNNNLKNNKSEYDVNNFLNKNFDNINENDYFINLDKIIYISKNLISLKDFSAKYLNENNFVEHWINNNNNNNIQNLKIKKIICEISDFESDNYQVVDKLRNGYLIDDNVGEDVLFNRSKRALQSIKSGKVKNPYLINYLFNAKLIKFIESYQEKNANLNFKLNLNYEQKNAVVKAINSNDIFVIQGPPGTGKTQVISEIIYQLSLENKKILLASQNHEAINNVIDRMENNPNVNKIRLMPITKRNDNEFSAERIILNYYKSIYKKIFSDLEFNQEKIDNLLKCKNDIEQSMMKYQQLLNDQKEVVKINNERAELKNNIQSLKNNIQSLKMLQFETDDNEYFINLFLKGIDYYDVPDVINFSNDLDEYLNNELDNDLSIFALKYFNAKIENDFFLNKLVFIFGLINRFEPAFNEFVDVNREYAKKINFKETYKLELKSLNIKKDSLLMILNKSNFYFSLVSLKNSIKNKILYYKESKKNINNIEKLQHLEIRLKSFENDLRELNVIKEKQDEGNKKIINEINVFNKNIKNIYNIDISLSSENILDVQNNELKKIDGKIYEIRERLIRMKKIYEDIKKVIGLRYSDLTMDKKKSDLENYQIINETKKYSNFMIENLVNIFAMTLTSNNMYNFEKISKISNINFNTLKLDDQNFDFVIIDEASKATTLEIIMPLIYGKSLILVGDYRQLPPVVNLRNSEVNEINNWVNKKYDFNELDNIINNSLFKQIVSVNNDMVTTILKEQYRSHRQICDVVNSFYDDQLITSPETTSLRSHDLIIENYKNEIIISPKSSVYWIDSSVDANMNPFYESSEETSTSLYNELEIKLTINTVKMINENIKNHKLNYKPNVAVISFYKLHIKKIKFEINKLNLQYINIKTSTVDDFQGKESDYVIVNIVRNPEVMHQKYGRDFLKRYERINVAFSRARELLIIIGSIRAVEGIDVKIPKIANPNEYDVKKVYKEIIDKISKYAKILQALDIMRGKDNDF